MKAGKVNKATSSNTNISADVGAFASNIVDNDSLKVFSVTTDNSTITVILDDAIVFEGVAFFNVLFEDDLILRTYDTGAGLIETKTFTASDVSGFQFQNLIYEPTSTTLVKTIEIEFDGTSTDFENVLGYFWIGDWIDFNCLETFQAKDTSNDSVTVTKVNGVQFQSEYKFQGYNVTTNKKVEFSTLRANMRTIFLDGYANKRPFFFDVEPQIGGEVLLGILDAPTAQYDNFDIDDNYEKAQTTIGIREVT